MKKLTAYLLSASWVRFRIWRLIGHHNAFVGHARQPQNPASGFKELHEVMERSWAWTDINDHLVTLFTESLSVKPKMMIELGVRGGESTFVLGRVAKLCGSKLVSVDVEDCSSNFHYSGWKFVQKDDIAFAKEFKQWCQQQGAEPWVDILFVDTSHLFAHTLQEIESWFPYLSDRSKVFFHDTNLEPFCFRKDGSIVSGWDNQRGVIKALESYFQKRFDESKPFLDIQKGWRIKHWPHCFGFTMLEKIMSESKFTPL